MEKKRLGPKDALFPQPAALVACGDGKQTNVTTVVRVSVVSSDPDPATILISLHKDRLGTSLIRASGEFSVNLASAALFSAVELCGNLSGRDLDKFAAASLTPVRGTLAFAPIVAECPYNIECRVVREMLLGEWVLFFGEIVECHVDRDAVSGENDRISLERIDPLAYGLRQYLRLGEKKGDAFVTDAEKALDELRPAFGRK